MVGKNIHFQHSVWRLVWFLHCVALVSGYNLQQELHLASYRQLVYVCKVIFYGELISSFPADDPSCSAKVTPVDLKSFLMDR